MKTDRMIERRCRKRYVCVEVRSRTHNSVRKKKENSFAAALNCGNVKKMFSKCKIWLTDERACVYSHTYSMERTNGGLQRDFECMQHRAQSVPQRKTREMHINAWFCKRMQMVPIASKSSAEMYFEIFFQQHKHWFAEMFYNIIIEIHSPK